MMITDQETTQMTKKQLKKELKRLKKLSDETWKKNIIAFSVFREAQKRHQAVLAEYDALDRQILNCEDAIRKVKK